MHQVGEYEESNSINGSSLIISCGFGPVSALYCSGYYIYLWTVPILGRQKYYVEKKRVMKPPPEGTVEMVMWDRDIFSLS